MRVRGRWAFGGVERQGGAGWGKERAGLTMNQLSGHLCRESLDPDGTIV